MAERIPEEQLKEIQKSVDIVDVISEYIHLEKKGRNFFGLCPFHGENTPSFSVSPDKQIFHCFGCGVGGNVYTFLMEIEGISFQEAVIKLAEQANITLDIDTTQNQTPQQKEANLMIQAHELLRKLYHHLLVHTSEGQNALEYLLNRGFTKDVIDTFQIGYALNKWDFDYQFLKTRGFSETLLEKAGLIIKSQNAREGYFDRFRDRIIFPIFDNKGNTVAFSGRVMDNSEPKYLNSPETIIFQKGRILYNFNLARPAIRKKQTVVLFEGFADTISAFSAGIDNGVGTMGTALTNDHIQLIKRNADRVILCFDNDNAGRKATLRTGEMLQEAGCLVQVAMLHDAKDPDEYIKKKGPENFKNEVIGTSTTLMSFKMDYYRMGKNLQNEGDRLIYIEQVLTEVSNIDNAVERDVYLRQLSEEFSISLDALKAQQRKIFYQLKKGSRKEIPQQKITVVKQDKKLPKAYYNAERMLIAHMLKSIQKTKKIQEQLKDFTFNEDNHQAILTYLYAYYEEGNEPDLSLFLNFINDDSLRKVVSEIGMLEINEELSDKELNDYINQVLKHQKLQKIKEKEAEAKLAEAQQDYKKASEIAREIMLLRKSL